MWKTALCRQLGVTYPIFSVGFGGGMAGPELAAAVSNAGACGVLGGGGVPAPYVRYLIRQVRALTEKPFGVNIILPLLQEGQIETCLDEKVPFLVLFWGDPRPYVEEAHRRGTKVFLQVGSVEEAVAAAEAGVDAIIAQGVEAGGHVKSTTALSTIVPAVVEAVHPVPVIAAGGIANGRGIVAAFSLGAQGVSLGTRFLCSEEARVVRAYKERVVRGRAEDTVHTFLFDVGWPDAAHRVLRNKAVEEWEAAGRPAPGRRPGEGEVVGTMPLADTTVEVPRYAVFPPMPGFTGDIEYTALYAGESCSLVNEIKSAGQIVRDLVREAEEVVKTLNT
ncbi:MAG: nitronate monooxygenase [Thermodesulfobacteriota bacterium]|jgi:nitronate monooxygenase/enoyl-[acyl-carrier protein] reductase II